MPELPEVECLRRSLEPHLLGRTVTRARLSRRDICEVYPRGRATPTLLLEGSRIAQLLRRGKQLALATHEGPLLLVHLGMSGQLLFMPSPSKIRQAPATRPKAHPMSHVHAQWTLSFNGVESGRLLFRDPRRFGGLWTFPSREALITNRWSSLGPDALTITPAQLAPPIASTRRSIKAALLDQSVLAGVGNIYADEALFLAGIRPKRLASALKPAQIDALASAIRQVLLSSIATGGSTLRDYRDANGRSGSSQLTHAVYGRSGQSCIRCNGPLKSGQVAQRTTVWCPRCQH